MNYKPFTILFLELVLIKNGKQENLVRLKIIEIKGVGPSYGEKLESLNIKTTYDLLKKCTTPQDRRKISKKSKISETIILKWVNMIDLLRIKGIGAEISEFMEYLGTDTINKLANSDPEILFQKMKDLNNNKNIIKRTPTLRKVENWISQAKEIPRIVKYFDDKQTETIGEFLNFDNKILEDNLQNYLQRVRQKKSIVKRKNQHLLEIFS